MLKLPPNHSNLVDPERCEICPVCNGVGYVPRKENVDFHRAMKTENRMKLSEWMDKFANAPLDIAEDASRDEAIAIVESLWKDVVLIEWMPEVAQLEAEVERLREELNKFVQVMQEHTFKWEEYEGKEGFVKLTYPFEFKQRFINAVNRVEQAIEAGDKC